MPPAPHRLVKQGICRFIINEELPDRFRDLLAQLKAKGESGSDGAE